MSRRIVRSCLSFPVGARNDSAFPYAPLLSLLPVPIEVVDPPRRPPPRPAATHPAAQRAAATSLPRYVNSRRTAAADHPPIPARLCFCLCLCFCVYSRPLHVPHQSPVLPALFNSHPRSLLRRPLPAHPQPRSDFYNHGYALMRDLHMDPLTFVLPGRQLPSSTLLLSSRLSSCATWQCRPDD